MSGKPTYEELEQRVRELEKGESRRMVRKDSDTEDPLGLLSILNGIDEPVYVCDPATYEMIFVNKVIEGLFGLPGNKKCYEFLQHRDSPCPFCTNDKILGDAQGRSYVWEHQNEATGRWYRCIDKAIPWPDGRIVRYEMAVDITDRKRFEEALKRSSEKTRHFAYSVSHDLKSPSVAIHGLAKRLRTSYADMLDEKGAACCDQIMKAAEHIFSLVQQINVYISTSSTALTIERVNLKDTLQMIKEEFTSQFAVRKIKWSEPEGFPELNADRNAVLRMLRNLVDNALKYGGDSFNELRIGYGQTNEVHIISVGNNGVMIRPEHHEEIFGPFQRCKTAEGVDGSGLGLAIVKELAERHGGKVWVESGEEKWTVFHVSISKNL